MTDAENAGNKSNKALGYKAEEGNCDNDLIVHQKKKKITSDGLRSKVSGVRSVN